MTNAESHNAKSKKNITCRNILSTIRPVPHDESMPVPIPSKIVYQMAIDLNYYQGIKLSCIKSVLMSILKTFY